ncbi:hypothetical protein [Sphingobacterium sp. E70]|nr:hypothetical protein [Sphingobacterium sp. E70]
MRFRNIVVLMMAVLALASCSALKRIQANRIRIMHPLPLLEKNGN